MTAPRTVRQWLREGRETLEAADHPAASPQLEAELLLARCLDKPRSYLFAHGDKPAPEAATDAFRALIDRRARGEPIAYITGEQEFWSLALRVNPAVLIPRPETELLVELALERLAPEDAVRVADIGTGSGAIALAIASERPRAEVHAVDLSAEALDVAQDNAQNLGLSNIAFYCGSWCEPLDGEFDAVLSNPPYVRSDDGYLHTGDLRFEPQVALTPGADEFLAFRAIAQGAGKRVRPGGWLLFEHGFDQGAAVRTLLEERGWEAVETFQDLAHRDRVTLGRKPS